MKLKTKTTPKKFRIEFHVHTKFSKDSLLTKFFLLAMFKIKKINCVAITDHNSIEGALSYQEFFEKKGVKVIVGEEIFSKDGEIIGLYLNKKIEPNLSAKETVDKIKKQKGFVYIPHPYDEKRSATVITKKALLSIKNDIDFMEIHNGRNVKNFFSKKQEEIAKNIGATPIIGSDAHKFYELGRNYCNVNSIDKINLKSEIEKRDFHIKRCIKVAHFHTKIVKLLKKLKEGDINGIYRIIKQKVTRIK